jgi:ribonuclease P protein component
MSVDRSPPRGRFGASDRLRTRGDFNRVFGVGRRIHGRRITIVVAPAASERCRLGLAISRGAGNAPQRARLRRVCREAFRGLRHDWPQPVDVVVMARTPWPGLGLADMQAELGKLMSMVRWAKI